MRSHSFIHLIQSKIMEGAIFLDCGTDLGSSRHVPGKVHTPYSQFWVKSQNSMSAQSDFFRLFSEIHPISVSSFQEIQHWDRESQVRDLELGMVSGTNLQWVTSRLIMLSMHFIKKQFISASATSAHELEVLIFLITTKLNLVLCHVDGGKTREHDLHYISSPPLNSWSSRWKKNRNLLNIVYYRSHRRDDIFSKGRDHENPWFILFQFPFHLLDSIAVFFCAVIYLSPIHVEEIGLL